MSSKNMHDTPEDATTEENTLSHEAAQIEEQADAAGESTELVSIDEESNALTAEESDDDEENEEEEEEYVAPEDQKVFGIPRFCFWGVMLGFAMGYFLCGIVGLITKQEQSSSMYIASCGIAGYVISYFLYRKRTKAKEEAAALEASAGNAAAQETNTDEDK